MSPTDALPDESYLTVAEVAATLKLNQQTVRNWIDQGSLPAIRVGRRVRIKRSDFERILDQSYSGNARAAQPASGPSADDFWGGEPVGTPEPGHAMVALGPKDSGDTSEPGHARAALGPEESADTSNPGPQLP
jgi:excisionase family DNA binding protein